MSMGMVRFPKFAPWWADAEHELLMAFGGKNDDFVDALAHLAAGIDKWVAPQKLVPEESIDSVIQSLRNHKLTFRELKLSDRRRRQQELSLLEN
jgi:hypothetical protein